MNLSKELIITLQNYLAKDYANAFNFIREFDFALFIYLHISKYKIYLKKIL
jgi:hypothetical protein